MIAVSPKICLVLLSILITANTVAAAPYCALRDPTRRIYELFPQTTNFRSIVRPISNETKKSIASVLPFSLHNREIGKHTLYVAMKGNKPLGLLHVRSEPGKWGLIEIAWALDLDLKIVDFRLQRCRDLACMSAQEDNFRDNLKGLNLEELMELISDDGNALFSRMALTENQKPLALAILRSAIKTIAITEAGWIEEIQSLRSPN